MTGAEALSRDLFLGGRLTLWQPRAGYRAGIDPVLLAAATPAAPGESVLELGCGVGTAILCLAARVPGLALCGVELQPDYAQLARCNAAENGVTLEVIEADIAVLPAPVRQRSFDHVIANPPYFQRARGTGATDTGRETALGGDTPLAVWIDAAIRRLRPNGRLTVIQRAERLPEVLAALDARAGSIEVLPLAPRAGRQAKIVLLRARKGGRGAFRLCPPLTLHHGAAHTGDGENYTEAVRAVLRDAAALSWPSG